MEGAPSRLGQGAEKEQGTAKGRGQGRTLCMEGQGSGVKRGTGPVGHGRGRDGQRTELYKDTILGIRGRGGLGRGVLGLTWQGLLRVGD